MPVSTPVTDAILGWLFYDATCPFCIGWVERVRGLLLRRGFHAVALQAAWARTRLGLAEDDPLVEMKLLTADGRIFGGADAFLELARGIWWAWPCHLVGSLPGIRGLLRAGYRLVARNRHCLAESRPLPAQTPRECRHLTSSFYKWP